MAVEENGPGAPGEGLEGAAGAHYVLLQEGAVLLRGVRLPDQDRGVHTQSEKTGLVCPPLLPLPHYLSSRLKATVFVKQEK